MLNVKKNRLVKLDAVVSEGQNILIMLSPKTTIHSMTNLPIYKAWLLVDLFKETKIPASLRGVFATQIYHCETCPAYTKDAAGRLCVRCTSVIDDPNRTLTDRLAA